jgi:Predicted membrane protein (DUF2157)
MGVHQQSDINGRELLDRWVERGFIQPEQADRIRSEEGWERRQPPPAAAAQVGGRAFLIVEALGYLGGVLIVVAAILIANWYWASISTWGRVALPVAAAALLASAGWLAYRHRSARTARLRAVLWLASTAAVAVALSVAGQDVLGLPDDENLALFAGVGTAAYAGLLYALFPTFLQQIPLFAGLGIAAGAAAGNLLNGDDAPTGLAIWGVGAMWLAFGWGSLLPPRRGSLALGAVATLIGAMITLSAGDWGYVFALITVAALVTLAVLLGDLLMLGIAAVGALQVLPATVMHFFPGALAAPLALLVAGLLLLAAALYATRRRERGVSRRTFRHQVGSTAAALAIAAAVALATTLAVLLVGR